jgi:hypothetical protein
MMGDGPNSLMIERDLFKTVGLDATEAGSGA